MDSEQAPQATQTAHEHNLSRLRQAWKMTESGREAGHKIETGFELEYYATNALFNTTMRAGALKRSVVDCDPEELRRRITTEMGWIEKEMHVVAEALKLLLAPANKK